MKAFWYDDNRKNVSGIQIRRLRKQQHMTQKIRQDISLGSNIRKLRMQSHLTQEQVAAKLQLQGIEISRSCYSQIECGTYNIKVSELIALAALFQTDFNAFFENL